MHEHVAAHDQDDRALGQKTGVGPAGPEGGDPGPLIGMVGQIVVSANMSPGI
ncbi:MAG: hypothetical protein ABIK96_08810 [bacterium]